MVGMVNNADPPIIDVVLVVEDTALGSTNMVELKTHYIVPTLEHFNGGPASDLEFASLSCSSSFSVVPFYASDCLPAPPSKIMGPYTSIKKVLTVFDRLDFCGGQGETHSSGQEGLASALQILQELELKRGGDIATAKHILYVANSSIYDMPVLDNIPYHGRNLDDLTMEIREKNIFVSVVAPRKIPALFKLYEKCGGDLKSAKEKNYSKEPRHLVLLRGYGLQERPVTPKPLAPVPSVSPAPLPNIPLSQFPGQARSTTPGQVPGQGQDNMMHIARQQQSVYRPQQQQSINQQGVMSQQQQGMPPQQQQQPQGMGQQQQQQTGVIGQQGVMGQQVIGQQQVPPSQSILNQVLNKAPGQQVRLPGQTDNTLRQILANPPQNIQQVKLGGLLNRPPGPSGPVMPSMQQQQQQQGIGQPLNQQQQQMRPGLQPGQGQAREREVIWKGELEWQEKVKDGPGDQKISHSVACSVSTSKENGVPEVKPDNWPSKLIMQLIPKSLVQTIGGQYFRNSKSVLFHPNDCDSLEALTKVMGTGFAGCVHFTGSCDIKVLILLYSNDKKAYLGFIPNDQISFVDRIRTVIQQQKLGQQQQQQQQQIGQQPVRMPMQSGQMVQQQPQVINMMQGGQAVQQQVSMGMQQQQQQGMMSQSVMMSQQQQQQGMMSQQSQQQQVMGQMRMMGPSGGMVGQQQQIIRGQQVMGQQGQYVRMSASQGMPQQRIMPGQGMTPGLRQILQQPGMGVQQGGIMQQQQMSGGMQQQGMQQMQQQQQGSMMMQQRMGGPVQVQGGMIGGQGVVGQQQQPPQNDPMLRELLN